MYVVAFRVFDRVGYSGGRYHSVKVIEKVIAITTFSSMILQAFYGNKINAHVPTEPAEAGACRQL